MKNLRIPEWQFSFNNSQTIRFSWQLFAQSYFLFTALTFSFSGAHLYIMSVPSLCLVLSVCKALLSAFTSFSESMKTKISEPLTQAAAMHAKQHKRCQSHCLCHALLILTVFSLYCAQHSLLSKLVPTVILLTLTMTT